MVLNGKKQMKKAKDLLAQGDVQQALCEYEKLAKKGYVDAQCELGRLYRFGENGVPVDPEKAVFWLKKAVENNSDEARTLLGQMYFHGDGVTKDHFEAITLTKRAAENGYCFAQYNLAYCYFHGQGVAKDLRKAFEWYKKSAEQGYSAAQYMVGQSYANGWGLVFDDTQKENLHLSADDIRGLHEFVKLEEAHRRGVKIGGKIPTETEVKYAFATKCKKLAESMLLSHVYRSICDKQAIEWYTKAAKQNYDKACYELGKLWYERSRAKQGETKTEWFDFLAQAAERGHKESQMLLGNCYLEIKKMPGEAVKWYRKAAYQGYAAAQHNLGYCYRYGIGVDKDPVEAVKWYRKAVEQGYAAAQNNLGVCYQYGIGVDKDPAEAVKWYRSAAERRFVGSGGNDETGGVSSVA